MIAYAVVACNALDGYLALKRNGTIFETAKYGVLHTILRSRNPRLQAPDATKPYPILHSIAIEMFDTTI